jgi:hypothetical protein
MSKRHINRRARRQSGYALVMIMFFLALLVLGMAAAAPTVLSNVQREREAEMVWRGKQYTRGIRMYYMKMNRFPTSLDDLTKPKTGIRFMRQAYKDPMNQVDGSWRLIYVGPNGQLIGSTSNRTIGFGGMGSTAMGGLQGTSGSLMGSPGQGQGLGGSNFGNNSFGNNGNGNGSMFNSSGFGMNQGNSQAGTTATATGAATTTANANGTPDNSTDDPSQPHSLAGPMDASNTIGGNIIGVGSKIDKKSFLIYQKAKNYKQFEFIWDPSQDTTSTVGRASTGIGTPIQGNTNGMSPAGNNPNSPFSNGMNPNQNQNQTQNPGQNPGQPGQPPSQNFTPGSGDPTPLQAPPTQ